MLCYVKQMTSKDGKYPAKNRETASRFSLVPRLHSAVHGREDSHNGRVQNKI